MIGKFCYPRVEAVEHMYYYTTRAIDDNAEQAYSELAYQDRSNASRTIFIYLFIYLFGTLAWQFV